MQKEGFISQLQVPFSSRDSHVFENYANVRLFRDASWINNIPSLSLLRGKLTAFMPSKIKLCIPIRRKNPNNTFIFIVFKLQAHMLFLIRYMITIFLFPINSNRLLLQKEGRFSFGLIQSSTPLSCVKYKFPKQLYSVFPNIIPTCLQDIAT